jgi:molybdate transport repressor ModE-like protein
MNRGIKPRCKLWLSSPDSDGAFGDGKWRLLQAIDVEGSLNAAASALAISYRKAWGDLRKMEEGLGVRLIETRRGGRDGGATRLTATGRCLLKAYSMFRHEVEAAVLSAYDRRLADILDRCATDAGH